MATIIPTIPNPHRLPKNQERKTLDGRNIVLIKTCHLNNLNPLAIGANNPEAVESTLRQQKLIIKYTDGLLDSPSLVESKGKLEKRYSQIIAIKMIATIINGQETLKISAKRAESSRP